MLDDGLEKVVQARHWFWQSRLIHRQTWWLESCVCTSQRRGGSIPSYFTRDSRCTAEGPRTKGLLKEKRNNATKGHGLHLIEDIKVLCINGKVMIPTSLWHRAVSWYHHYLQHPGHSHLKETMRSVMYWKGMRTTIRKYVKSCRSCQVNKRHSQKYGHLPPKCWAK